MFAGGIKTVQATFTDKDDVVYDPDSQVIKFYDSTETLIESFTQANVTRISEGIYFIDYEVPDASETGRWTCEWTAVVSSESYEYNFAFEVRSRSWPTVAELRTYLNDITTDRISNTVVDMHTSTAIIEVDLAKSATAAVALVQKTYLILAGYYCYRAYCVKLERSLGQLPATVYENLLAYKETADKFLEYVARGVGQTAMGPIMSYTPTVVPESYEEDAEGQA